MENPFVADQYFKNTDFTKDRLPRADYEECIFEGCQFQNGFLDNQNFVDCTFLDCNLSNANVSHTIWNNVQFEDCKMVGLAFEASQKGLLNFHFKNCNLSLTSFYRMALQKIHFSGSNLTEVDFTETDLQEADFSDCNLTRASFKKTNLKGANLYTALHFNIDPELNSLKKAKFSKDNIIGLLKKYDIVVT